MRSKSVFLAIISVLFLAGCAPTNTNQPPTISGVSTNISLPTPTLGPTFSLSTATPAPTATATSITLTVAPTNSNFAKNQMYKVAPTVLPANQLKNRTAEIVTAKGKIDIQLFGDEAPLTVSNFIFLSTQKFYNGLTFHRREEGFVIQGGDPLGTGAGGPGYSFEDEPVTRAYTRGILAMANSGPDTNGSQFFILLANHPLPPSYTIFGQVTSGMDVADKIKVGDVMTSVTIK